MLVGEAVHIGFLGAKRKRKGLKALLTKPMEIHKKVFKKVKGVFKKKSKKDKDAPEAPEAEEAEEAKDTKLVSPAVEPKALTSAQEEAPATKPGPKEDGKFPWGIVLIGGGVLTAAAIAYIALRRR